MPAGVKGTANSVTKAAEQEAKAPTQETSSRTSGRVDIVNEGSASGLPTAGAQQQQQMSEADFWKMMQK